MYYEINVALKGNHFFATHPRSITDLAKAHHLMKMFKHVFPSEVGFTLLLTRREEPSEVVQQWPLQEPEGGSSKPSS